MPKGVGNLHHHQSHAPACNQRYLPALSHAADPAPAHREPANLAEPKRVHGCNSAGINPARRASAAISRLLKRLHLRGLIAKVPRTRPWRVTESGRQILSHTLATH